MEWLWAVLILWMLDLIDGRVAFIAVLFIIFIYA